MQNAWLFAFGGFIVGFLVGFALLWHRLGILREKLLAAEKQVQDTEQLRQENTELKSQIARLQEQQRWLEQAEARLRETFQALANDVLQRTLQVNSEEFIKRARDQLSLIVQPLTQDLDRLEMQLRELESKREQAYGSLERLLTQLAQSHQELQRATSNLAEVFRRAPTLRGSWGELQLRRIVEYAGMEEYVDFEEQEGPKEARPDLIVRLPNKGILLVDAKVPLQHFLEAMEASDEQTRAQKLREHANAVRNTIRELSRREYWQRFNRTPEFVVMFVPHEGALAAAFAYDPALLDEALRNRVLPTSPITLLALLKAIAYGWMQHRALENAQEIIKSGKEVYERLCTFLGHLKEIGKQLNGLTEAYNKSVGSLETRVFPALRRLKELQVSNQELPELPLIENQPRPLTLPESQQNAEPKRQQNTKPESQQNTNAL